MGSLAAMVHGATAVYPSGAPSGCRRSQAAAAG